MNSPTVKPKLLRRLKNTFSQAAIVIYFIGFTLTLPYFNWVYAKDNGFVNWLLLGEVVPTFKAFIWPYTLTAAKYNSVQSGKNLKTWTEEEKANGAQIILSIETFQSAVKLANADPKNQDTKQIMGLIKSALEESKAVRDDVLEKALIGMSTQWRNTYQASLELSLQGWEEKDHTKITAADDLMGKWDNWGNAHRSEIRIPK